MHREFLIQLVSLMLVMMPSCVQLPSKPRGQDLQRLIDSFGTDGKVLQRVLKNLKRVGKLTPSAYVETQRLVEELRFPAVYRKRIESSRIRTMLGVHVLTATYDSMARQCMKEILWGRDLQARMALTHFCVALADGLSPRRAELKYELNQVLDAALFDEGPALGSIQISHRKRLAAPGKTRRVRQVA